MERNVSITKAIKEIEDVLQERNAKYGDNNLLDYGILGLVIRMSDKLSRIKNALVTGNYDIIEDALIDLAGYSINGYRLLKEKRIKPLGEVLDGFNLVPALKCEDSST